MFKLVAGESLKTFYTYVYHEIQEKSGLKETLLILSQEWQVPEILIFIIQEFHVNSKTFLDNSINNIVTETKLLQSLLQWILTCLQNTIVFTLQLIWLYA